MEYTVIQDQATLGLLGFSLSQILTPHVIIITKIHDTCVVKDRIRIGNQLIGVDEDSILPRSTFQEVQPIHSKLSNPIRTLTFKRRREEKIDPKMLAALHANFKKKMRADFNESRTSSSSGK